MIDYGKLTNDLKRANELAVEAVANIDDGGTANLDSVVLRLPRARESTVLKAIQDAGLYCRGKRDWLGAGYFITPTSGGQGNKRSVGVEVLKKHLEEQGCTVSGFYQMD